MSKNPIERIKNSEMGRRSHSVSTSDTDQSGRKNKGQINLPQIKGLPELLDSLTAVLNVRI
jgi:hypothetical protein